MAIESKHWTILDKEENLIHQGLLGSGGYGEVHKVSKHLKLLANFISSCLIRHLHRYATRLIALMHPSKFSASSNFKTFARKLIRLWAGITQPEIDNEVRAINKLCKSNHPNIVQVLGYGQLKADGVFYFIDMELCETSLEKYLQGEMINGVINWNEVRIRNEVHEHAYNIMQQILNGMIYIHCLNEVHRDLSPNNGISF